MEINGKYNGIIFIAIFALTIVIILVVRNTHTNYYTTIIDAKIRDKNDNQFPGCYIKWNGNNYLITDYYRYHNDYLIEYKTPTSSGFAVFNLTDSTVFYGGSRNRYKPLYYKQKSDHIRLDNEKFKIDYIKNDTIISKINDTIIKITAEEFVDESKE
jgi:hypothetical protein